MIPKNPAPWCFLAVLLLSLLACGSLAPPESCGEGIGGSADEATFARYFTQMSLAHSQSGAPGEEDPDGGTRFPSGSALAVQSAALSEVSLRVCVQERKGGGKIAFDQSQDLAPGENSFHVGIFPSGMYVARVIVNGTLVQNLPFSIE